MGQGNVPQVYANWCPFLVTFKFEYTLVCSHNFVVGRGKLKKNYS